MEEAQGMRLQDLRQIQDFAQVNSCVRDLDRQQRVTCLSRCDQVADRADAAYAGSDGRHFGERPSLDQLLKTAKLGDVEACGADVPRLVQLNGYLAVSLDSGNRVDGNCLIHGYLFLRAARIRSAFSNVGQACARLTVR